MSQDKPPIEVRRAGNLKLIHDSIGFVLWDIDDFLENRNEYIDIDPKRAAQIDDCLYWLLCRALMDGKLRSWMQSQHPVMDKPPTSRTHGVDTFAD